MNYFLNSQQLDWFYMKSMYWINRAISQCLLILHSFLPLHLQVSGGEWTSQAKWRPWWSGTGGPAGVRGAHATSVCVSQRGQGQRFHIPLWHKGKFLVTRFTSSLKASSTCVADEWYKNICREIPEKTTLKKMCERNIRNRIVTNGINLQWWMLGSRCF